MKYLHLFLVLPLLLGCEKKADDGVWLGYAEADTALIAPPQGGWITSLKAQRGQAVKPGDVLFVLDDTREAAGRNQAAAALAQARASLAQEQANLAYTATDLGRQDRLAQAGAGTPTQRDLARNANRQSQARIQQLKAQIAQMEASLGSADYTLSQRDIVAQSDGVVQDIYFRQGEFVPAAAPVISLLPPANVFVRFFVPQSQLSKAALGQKVRITCDGCAPITATISFIAAGQEFTPPVIFSAESRDKLVFKLEARLPGGLKLHPGQPVEVRPL